MYENPHLNADLDPDCPPLPREVARLDRQYRRRQRYAKKYGRGSMRSLRGAFRRSREEGETFRAWLRSLDNVETPSPKVAKIRAA